MQWVIERYDEDVKRLEKAIDRSKHQWCPANFKPIAWEIEATLNNFIHGLYYGSIQGALCAQKKYPNLWTVADFNKFTFMMTSAYLHRHMLNQHYYAKPLGAINVYAVDLNHSLFLEKSFIRPNASTKTFPGQVISQTNSLKDIIQLYNLRPTDIVIVDSYHDIGKEWRLIVDNSNLDNREIIGASLYMDKDKMISVEGCPNEVKEFALSVLKDCPEYDPDPFFTLDICESHGSLFVLEANSLSCSGLYSCKLDELVERVGMYFEYMDS